VTGEFTTDDELWLSDDEAINNELITILQQTDRQARIPL